MAQKTLPVMSDATGQKIASMLENVTVGPNNIVDNLTTADSTKVLSANMGKTLNDKWNSTVKRNIGELVYSSVPLVDSGLKLADGSYIIRSEYADFYDYIVSLVGQSSAVITGTGHSSTSDYGKYIYDSTNSRVYLPDLNNMFIEGTTDSLGTYMAPGLPDLDGKFGGAQYSWPTDGVLFAGDSLTNSVRNTVSMFDGAYTSAVRFKASRYNSIYGNSSTVQPPAIKQYIYIVVANVVKPDYVINIDNVMTDINDLNDKITTYSTTEKAWGKWIDGKTIYRKTYVGTSTTGEFRADIGVPTIDLVVNMELTIKEGNVITMGNYWFSNNDKQNCYLDLNANKIVLRAGSEYSFGYFIVHLYYTKSS